jgi:hypothetical protein
VNAERLTDAEIAGWAEIPPGPRRGVHIDSRILSAAMTEIQEHRKREAAVRALHKPHSIYEECGHNHDPDDDGVVYVEDVGYSCSLLYKICDQCCAEGDYQSENCAGYHDHGPDLPICATIRALDGDKPEDGEKHGT